MTGETTWVLTILVSYLIVGYFISKYVSKLILNKNRVLKLLIFSLIYAIFFGVGIAGNDGDPGFGFPAPNGIAIYLMASIGFMDGVLIGLKILCAWWVAIFISMLIRSNLRLRKHQPHNSL